MEQGLTRVVGSIAFRDAAMNLDREDRPVYARRSDVSGPTYRILVGMGTKIDFVDLFHSSHAPVHMEDFAQALVPFGDQAPAVDVFTK